MENSAQLPSRIGPADLDRFESKEYRKTSTTKMVGPVTLSQDIVVETKEGEYRLPAGWEGMIAFDSDGDPYPVAKDVFDATYEEITNG